MITIGGSAGAVDVLLRLVGNLPADLPAALLVVIHRSPEGPGLLAEILEASGPLPAVLAEEGQRLEQGRIYVAPPDRHLLVNPGGSISLRKPAYISSSRRAAA